MFNKDNILDLLDKGYTPDEIAKKMADALNDAQKEYDAKKVDGQKRADMAAFIDAGVHYLMTYHPDSSLIDEIDLSSPEKIDATIDNGIKLFEEIVPMYENILKLDSKLKELTDKMEMTTFPLRTAAPTVKIKDTDSNVKSAPKPTKKVNAQIKFDPDKIIADFVNKFSN